MIGTGKFTFARLYNGDDGGLVVFPLRSRIGVPKIYSAQMTSSTVIALLLI